MASFGAKAVLFLNKFFKLKTAHPLDLEEKGLGSYARWEYDLAKKTLAYFPPEFGVEKNVAGKVILDLCCGAGGKAVFLSELGAKKVVGVDLGEDFITQAKVFAAAKGAASCEFVIGDAQSLPFPDGTFDMVFSFDAFEHVADPAKMLSEARRMLCKGGRLIMSFTTWHRHDGHHLMDAIRVPWVHLFVSERTLLEAYKGLVSPERYALRAGSHDSTKLAYVNKMNDRWAKKLVYSCGMKVLKFRRVTYPGVLKILAKIGFAKFLTRVYISILEEP